MMTTKPPYADKVKEVTYEEAKLLRSLGVNVGADWRGVHEATYKLNWNTTVDLYLYSNTRWAAVERGGCNPSYECFFFIAKDDDCGQA